MLTSPAPVELSSPAPVEPGTVLARMLDAGLDEATARSHLAARWVRVGGTITTDPETPAPRSTWVSIAPWEAS